MQDLVGRTDQAIDVGRWVEPILGNGRGQIEAGNQGLTERPEGQDHHRTAILTERDVEIVPLEEEPYLAGDTITLPGSA